MNENDQVRNEADLEFRHLPKPEGSGQAIPASPAEPESGIQRDGTELLAQIRQGAECGRGRCLDCDTIAKLIDNFISGKPNPPADHVEHVLQNPLYAELIERRACDLYGAFQAAANHQTMWHCVILETKRLLSETRSTSPATSVSASPDSAPWTVRESPLLGHGHVICGVRRLNKDPILLHHCYKFAAAHNATLPAPRSEEKEVGSEVSGVEKQ